MTVGLVRRSVRIRELKQVKGISAKNRTKTIIIVYSLLALTYIALVWFLPPNRNSLDKYNLTILQAKLINLTFILPLIGVWFSALYGYVRFRSYALVIRKSPEGQPFKNLANGLMVLSFGLPLTAILSSVLNFYSARNPDWLPATTIIRNYVDIAIYFSAFALLFTGAKGLYTTLKLRQLFQPAYLKYNTTVIIIVSTVFAWLLLANPLTVDTANSSIYYLPNWLIISTIAVPYLLAWYYGSMASYWLITYRNRIKGEVYRQPFTDLAKGIAVIVFDAMLIRFISSLSPRLTRLNLTPLLLIVYGLVLLYILGYGLVARGAKGLKKIEDV